MEERSPMGEVLDDAHVLRDQLGELGPLTSSKLFCWVALDRAVELAPLLGDGARPVEWAATRRDPRRDPRAGLVRGAPRPTEAHSARIGSTPACC